MRPVRHWNLVQWAHLAVQTPNKPIDRAARNGFAHRVMVLPDRQRIAALAWFADNGARRVTFLPAIRDKLSGTTYYFEDPVDATAFKIRWG